MALRRLLPTVLAAAALVAPATALAHGNASQQVARAAIKGEHKVLVVLATWGPQSYTREEVHRVVFEDTNRWIQRSSYGLTSISGDTTPWLNAFEREPSCDVGGIAARAKAAARGAGYDPSAYARWIYVVPQRIRCPFTGVAFGEQVMLNGAVFRKLVAHELGHTYGIGFHANSWDCAGGSCRSVEYGDPFDTMGRGSGDFNAYEKFVIGWLNEGDVARARANAVHRVAELERPSDVPQALVVTTARHEYWLDHRGEVPPESFVDFPLTSGLLVHAGPNQQAPSAQPVYPAGGILLPDPLGAGRAAVLPGEAWGEAGAFRVSVLGKTGTALDVRFEWTDTTAPAPPRLVDPPRVVRARGRRTLEVAWTEGTETGSGTARYELRIDRGAPRGSASRLGAFRPRERDRRVRPGPDARSGHAHGLRHSRGPGRQPQRGRDPSVHGSPLGGLTAARAVQPSAPVSS